MSGSPGNSYREGVDALQFNRLGKLHHLLTLDGLDRATLVHILDTAENFTASDGVINKVPLLRGKTVANLFFENSTRTRSAFELAATRLSADVLNVDLVSSSTAKGESLLDTLQVLQAMQCDMFVVRHHQAGAAHFIARHVDRYVNVLNGGDGRHSHPTQGLLDMFTIRRYKGDFSQLKVVVVGDIRHSRVARSGLSALTTLGTGEICLCAPRTLLPDDVDVFAAVSVEPRIERALADADVIMCLRLQNERMHAAVLPSSGEFFRTHGLTDARLALANPDAIVLHPGPTNRGVEIAASVADGPQAKILDQVTFGVAIRMAVMAITIGSGEALRSDDRQVEAGQVESDQQEPA